MDKTTQDEFQKIADYMGANDIKAERNNSQRKQERDQDVIDNENADFDLGELADENCNSIFELAEYIGELEATIEDLKERVETLEGR